VPGKGDDPPEAGGRGARLRPPSDDDWGAVIYQFRIFRSFEDSTVLQRAEALPALLEEEAAALCGIADEVDRTLDTHANVWKYRASTILARVESRGYVNDTLWDHVRGELVQHLLEAVEQSPSSLRQRAFALRNASEDAQSTLNMYAGHVKRLRSSRGPAPSVAMYTLFAATDRWRVSILEIARRFVATNVPSESTSDEPDPIAQWKGILEKARGRARKLRKTKGTG
jgi:hypothetical protein